MVQKLNLFSTGLYSYHVDPTSYDKNHIVEKAILNYNKNPKRNNWDNKDASIHHYYNDWNNPNFLQINLESLEKVYLNLFKHFVHVDLIEKYADSCKINFRIENITVFRGKGEYMGMHDHLDGLNRIAFNAIHYLKVAEKSEIKFFNPLLISQVSYRPLEDIGKYFLDNNNLDNSSYYKDITYWPKEDEIIIIPAYLKHQVPMLIEDTNEYRIAIITNISITSV